MKILRCCLIILLALLITAASCPQPVIADIAPPKPPSGSNLEPGTETTQVRMMAETVIIDVPTLSEHATGEATVTATFTMRNLSDTEERMDVRFPLCSGYSDAPTMYFDELALYRFSAVEMFSAQVNGTMVPVTTSDEEIPIALTDEVKILHIPCWANFPVVFPPKKDVTIKVQYIQVAGMGENGHGTINFVTMYYILFTGAAWKDTIGSADIIARFPIDANTLHVNASPDVAIFSGKEVRWHFENFEPEDEFRKIKISYLQPKYWLKIEEERANTRANPNDGEAWGRLGKVLKDAYSSEYGLFRENIFQESLAAYQKAVAILPNNADWHYGFADLVCNQTIWNEIFPFIPNAPEPARLCLEQVEQTLKINPQHEKGNQLLQMLESAGWIKTSGGQPVYLILTPDGSLTPSPTFTPRPSHTARPPTATITIPPPTPPQPTATTVPTAAAAPALAVSLLPGFVVGILVLAGILYLLTRRR